VQVSRRVREAELERRTGVPDRIGDKLAGHDAGRGDQLRGGPAQAGLGDQVPAPSRGTGYRLQGQPQPGWRRGPGGEDAGLLPAHADRDDPVDPVPRQAAPQQRIRCAQHHRYAGPQARPPGQRAEHEQRVRVVALQPGKVDQQRVRLVGQELDQQVPGDRGIRQPERSGYARDRYEAVRLKVASQPWHSPANFLWGACSGYPRHGFSLSPAGCRIA
jgi:hypothetical protein